MVYFKDLGKSAKDLFKKSYDYKNEVKVVSNASGVKVESGGSQGKGIQGYTKVNFKDATLGAVELELHSTGATKAQTKFAGLADGIDLTLAGDISGALSAETTYNKDSCSILAKVAHNLSKGSTSVSASAALEVDGVTVGGQVDLDAANPASPKDYNVGAQYKQKDLTAALVTSSCGADITASYFQTVSGDLSLGGSMFVKPDAGSRLFTFGGIYNLDKATTVRAKADSNGIVATAITHKLASPAVSVNLSAQFDGLSSDFACQKMGVGLTF